MSFSILAQSILEHSNGAARLTDAWKERDGVRLVAVIETATGPRSIQSHGIDAIDALASMLAECARWEVAA